MDGIRSLSKNKYFLYNILISRDVTYQVNFEQLKRPQKATCIVIKQKSYR